MPAAIGELKQCTSCSAIKHITEFPKNNQKKDKLSSICKICNSEKTKAYMATEQGKKKRKEYEQTEKHKEYLEKYKQTEQSRQRFTKYHQSEKGRQKRKEYRASPEAKEKEQNHKWKLIVKKRAKIRLQQPKFSIQEKIRARKAVRQAVESGKIPSPKTVSCVDCGNSAKDYHHYNGYEKEHYLDVVPLCTSCHAKRHAIPL